MMNLVKLVEKLEEMAHTFTPETKIDPRTNLSEEALKKRAIELAYVCGRTMPEHGFTEDEYDDFSRVLHQTSELLEKTLA